MGLICEIELGSGHQSRVFRATVNGEPVVVKLTDSRVSHQSHTMRLELLAALAESTPAVIPPVPVESQLVNQIGEWQAVAYPFVAGRSPDATSAPEVSAMAAALADLHRALAQFERIQLPSVAALAHCGTKDLIGFGPAQLIHGDYSEANTMLVGNRLRIFDFDDCGYGPVEFEVGNTLYMVMFDAWRAASMRRYSRFRSWFVDAYRSASGLELPDDLLDAAIELRVQALRRWLDRPAVAPIGIRTATVEWHETLRAFVDSASTPPKLHG